MSSEHASNFIKPLAYKLTLLEIMKTTYRDFQIILEIGNTLRRTKYWIPTLNPNNLSQSHNPTEVKILNNYTSKGSL